MRIKGGVMNIDRVMVPTRCIGLPNLNERVLNRLAGFVQNTPRHDNALTQRRPTSATLPSKVRSMGIQQ